MSDITVSALYSSYEFAKQAVEELERSDVDTDNISIIASNGDKKYDSYGKEVAEDAGKGAGIGATVGGITGLLTGLGIMAIPGVGPVVAAGWLAATAAGAATGAAVGAATGGLLGALTEAGMSDEDAQLYAEHIRRGGALVCVKADEEEEAQIHAILNSYQRVDPDSQRTFFQQEGWNGFNPDATPLTAEEIREQRTRFSNYR